MLKVKHNILRHKVILKKKNRKHIRLSRIMYRNPIKRIIIDRVTITTPRKPNSARRKTVKANFKFSRIVKSYIPGGGHTLKKFSNVLVKGGGARDLPGIYTKSIRGALDLHGIALKTRRRSIYGTKKL